LFPLDFLQIKTYWIFIANLSLTAIADSNHQQLLLTAIANSNSQQQLLTAINDSYC